MAKEFTAKTVEEALSLAFEEFNLTLDQLDYTVIEQPAKGFMGIGAKPARILVMKKVNETNQAIDFLDGMFSLLKIAATSEIIEEDENKLVINLNTIDSSSLIGYRGEVLDALQCLAGAVANKNNEDYKRVVVDCEKYRERREETLKSLAFKLAEKAVRTNRKITLEPMNPFERRVIHSALVDQAGIKTVSEGKEPIRYIAIIPDGYDPKSHPRGNFADKRERQRDGNYKNKFDRKPRPDRDGVRKNRDRPMQKTDKPTFGKSVFLGNSKKEENKEI